MGTYKFSDFLVMRRKSSYVCTVTYESVSDIQAEFIVGVSLKKRFYLMQISRELQCPNDFFDREMELEAIPQKR